MKKNVKKRAVKSTETPVVDEQTVTISSEQIEEVIKELDNALINFKRALRIRMVVRLIMFCCSIILLVLAALVVGIGVERNKSIDDLLNTKQELSKTKAQLNSMVKEKNELITVGGCLCKPEAIMCVAPKTKK